MSVTPRNLPPFPYEWKLYFWLTFVLNSLFSNETFKSFNHTLFDSHDRLIFIFGRRSSQGLQKLKSKCEHSELLQNYSTTFSHLQIISKIEVKLVRRNYLKKFQNVDNFQILTCRCYRLSLLNNFRAHYSKINKQIHAGSLIVWHISATVNRKFSPEASNDSIREWLCVILYSRTIFDLTWCLFISCSCFIVIDTIQIVLLGVKRVLIEITKEQFHSWKFLRPVTCLIDTQVFTTIAIRHLKNVSNTP